jgi:beta-glucosidase
VSTAAFPPGFLWGVATSAQQVEGAFDEAGRGESIWDRFAAAPGNIADGTDSRVACDHYHRWRDDIERMRWLGVNSYRFSIAWPRVFPNGAAPVNTPGLDFYDALVDGLLSAGIQPFVTLNHWDVPQALQDRGGWTSRATVDAFTEFAEAVSGRLGDRVRHWVTHNEPWCISHLGYQRGEQAPGLRVPADSLRVAHHLLLSHGRAVEVLRRNSPGSEVGIVLILSPIQPASGSDADQDAARELDGSFNRWFLDPLYRGAYPADAVADRIRLGHLEGPEPGFIQPGDLACIGAPTDFLGVNYYSRIVVGAGPDGAPVAVQQAPDSELTHMGWEVYPQGLHDVLLRVKNDYGPRRLYVTESGAAYDDEGRAPDERRVEYLRSHVAAAQRAFAGGAPLHGYFAWSFMDNFEWGQGLSKRFGLFHVDYASQRRTARESAHWYRDGVRSMIPSRSTTQGDARELADHAQAKVDRPDPGGDVDPAVAGVRSRRFARAGRCRRRA